MKIDLAIVCDGVYGIQAERGNVNVQLTGVDLAALVQENREEIERILRESTED